MKISKIFVLSILLTILGSNQANSQGLSGLLKGSLGETISNFVEGVFSSSDLTIEDLAGEWKATGPAVCFQSDDMLKKAGGIAVASAIETKISPYFDKYGLNNASLVVDKDGKFTLTTSKLPKLSGNITSVPGGQKGVFNFNFTAMGMTLSSVTTYVQKSSGSMDIMFDASKLKTLLNMVSKFSGISVVQTVTGILDSYNGLCVGLSFKGTPTSPSDKDSQSKKDDGKESNTSKTGSGLKIGNLLNTLGIGSSTNTNNGTATTNTTTEAESSATEETEEVIVQPEESSSEKNLINKGLNALKGLLGK